MLKYKYHLFAAAFVALIAIVSATLQSNTASALTVPYTRNGDKIIIKADQFPSNIRVRGDVEFSSFNGSTDIYSTGSFKVAWLVYDANGNMEGACDGELVIRLSTGGTLTAQPTDASKNDVCDGAIPRDEGTQSMEDLQDPTNNTGLTPDEAAANSQESESTCKISLIGWILCPVTNFLANIADGIIGILNGFLEVPSTTIFENGSDAYNYWTKFRDYANILFVIAFLFIIFSQVTSFGISNYGIKKLLPKLFVVALLVNTSFYITGVAVDLSNFLGYSIADFLGGDLNVITSDKNQPVTNGIGPALSSSSGFGKLAASLLTLAIGGLMVYFFLATFIGLILSAIVVGILVVTVLTIRQAAVILLVVLSPLAFACLLLPNTEGIFKKWWSILKSMLLLFPIISLLYGFAKMAGTILEGVAGTEGTEGYNFLLDFMANILPILVLVLVYTVLKKSLDAINGLGGVVNGIANKGNGAKKAMLDKNQFLKYRQQRLADSSARIKSGAYSGRGGNWNPANLRSKVNRKLNQSSAYNKITGGFGADRDLVRQSQERKDVKEAIDMFNNDDKLVSAWATSGGDLETAKKHMLKSGNTMSSAQIEQFNKLKAAGHDRKSTSYLAAAQYLSEKGKGTASEVSSAIEQAGRTGAGSVEVDSAKAAAEAAYRSSGRGDALAELQTLNRGGDVSSITAAERTKAWGQVAPQSVHRESIDPTKNKVGADSYLDYLLSDRENTRKALAGYDKMESRAQGHAKGMIEHAALLHAAKTGVPISNIQEAKKYFGITQ